MPASGTGRILKKPLEDKDLFQASAFLADLVGGGSWRESDRVPDLADIWTSDVSRTAPSLQDFRQDFRKMLDDTETALLSLRRLRIRTLLALGRADLDDRIKPHQIRARLRGLSEAMVQGAWWLAENSLRQRFVHPIILERRNINPPLAICSLSRLGAGEPWYTTGPAPVFVHSRAAEFAPALTEKDFNLARRSDKEWLPGREYFHRLARRTMSFLSVPDPAGKGFDHMSEDLMGAGPAILPGALVILFGAFEEHFVHRRPVKERLALLRLRFLVGQERLGRAVEAAARSALLKTAAELGSRLKAGINAFYRDRAQAEGLPMARGGLLDIERALRLAQFRFANDDSAMLAPSPLKAMDLLVQAGALTRDERLTLNKSYSWQWFVANRMSLLGRRTAKDWEVLKAGRLDDVLGLPGAAEHAARMMKSARIILDDLNRESGLTAAGADAAETF